MSSTGGRGGGRGPPDGASGAGTTEDAFDALAHRRRRDVVHRLLSEADGVELRRLSGLVAAWETENPIERVDTQEPRRGHDARRRSHLPESDRIGVLRSDGDRGRVAPTAELEERRTSLRAERRSVEWCAHPRRLGGLVAGLSKGLVALPAIRLPPKATSIGPLGGVVFSLLADRMVDGPRRRRRLGSRRPPDG